MKLKNFWKRFWTLDRHTSAGFTLVELIVVIAILAILAGVGIPVYSGYITRANKTADQTLVSEVINAMMLQYYSDPDSFTGGSVILTTTTSKPDTDGGFADAAMTAAFGTNWENSVSLKSNDWTGTAIMNEAVNHFAGWTGTALGGLLDGTVTPVFKDDVDELYDLVEDTSIMVGGKVNMSGMELIQGAAGTTTGINAEDLATYWSGSTWDSSFLMTGGNDASYNEDALDDARDQINDGSADAATKQMFEQALANAAVIKARNTSLAIYVRNAGYPQYYNVIADFGGTIPADITAAGKADLKNAALAAGMTEEEATTFRTKVRELQGTYISSGQAYQDGLAYFGMMDAVANVNKNGNEETYWDDMEAAVDAYGSIARGETTLDKLQSIYGAAGIAAEGDIVISAVEKDGQLDFIVSPVDAKIAE